MQRRRQPRTFAHVRREGPYRSMAEARYARYLGWLQKLGVVASWQYEPKTFWFDKPTRPGLKGIRRGVTSYKPDFRVVFTENERTEWHEVKGWMSPRDLTKVTRFRRYYPEETLIVIDAAVMRQLRKTAGSVMD